MGLSTKVLAGISTILIAGAIFLISFYFSSFATGAQVNAIRSRVETNEKNITVQKNKYDRVADMVCGLAIELLPKKNAKKVCAKGRAIE